MTSSTSVIAAREDRATRASWPFYAVAGALFVLLMSTNLPAGLYTIYRERFGFSSITLTLVFATYAIVLIPSLVVFGQLSDQIGRRRVLLLGLGIAAAALVLLALARGTGWLFAARVLQGISVGATTGTATAALVELEPTGNGARAATAALLGQAGGSATGPIVAGVLAQYAPLPRALCYLLGIVIAAATALAVVRIPEPHHDGGRWRLQLPHVEPGTKGAFARAGLTAAAVWATGGLYISVVPSYASTLLGTSNLVVITAVASVMLAAACLVQLVCMRSGLNEVRAQIIGLLLLAAGCAALIVAFPSKSLAVLLIAAVLAGAGLGVGFFGAQTHINQLAPADRRGEVTAAFVICVYTGVATAAIAVGLLSEAVTLATAVGVVSAVLGLVAVGATAAHWSHRRD
ncbi:MAG TPA: MFS transporter [Micromonosporaceae bacterium]